MAIVSKLSVKAQTVLPLAVREHLGVGPGDVIEYELKEGGAVIRPATKRPTGQEDPFALFTEWTSEEDQEGYADL